LTSVNQKYLQQNNKIILVFVFGCNYCERINCVPNVAFSRLNFSIVVFLRFWLETRRRRNRKQS